MPKPAVHPGGWQPLRILNRLAAPLLVLLMIAAPLPRSFAQTAEIRPEDMAQQVQAVEIRKLQEEIIALQRENRLRERGGALLYWASGLSGLIGGAFALVLALLGNFLTRTYSDSQRQKIETERLKLEQDREFSRQEHNLQLLKGLGDENARVRLASVAVLLERISALADPDSSERRYMVDALLSVTKEDKPDDRLNKTIGDGIVRVLGAVCDGGEPRHSRTPLHAVDLQKTSLRDVYWADVDLRSVDLFGADFTRASLRRAHLQGAILYDTCLEDAVLRDGRLQGADLRFARLARADLRNADLTDANLSGADLSEARLDGASVDRAIHDEATKWPGSAGA